MRKIQEKCLCSSPLLGLIPPPTAQEPSLLGRNPSTMNSSMETQHPKHWDETEGAGDEEYPEDLGMQVGKGLEQNDW